MSKSIATTRGESTTKYEKIGSYNADYIVLDFIDFFWPWLKSYQKQIEGKHKPCFVFMKNATLIKN